MYYVNVYETTQAYGGPEEGGWWYSVGEFKECKGIFVSRDAAIAAVNDDSDELERKGKYRMGMHSLDGVGPDGEPDDAYLMRGGRWGESSVNVRVEDHVGQDYPLERPYYS